MDQQPWAGKPTVRHQLSTSPWEPSPTIHGRAPSNDLGPASRAGVPSAGNRVADIALARTAAIAPGTASMLFTGPVKSETQSLAHVPVVSEFSKHAFTEGGVYARSTRERALGVSGQQHHPGATMAGDGSKFSMGFYRKRVDWGPEYNARDEAGGERCRAQDALRKDFIASNQHKSGFNPITGMEYDASKDDYRPRGRVSLQDTAGPRPLRTVEGEQRDTEPGIRMFRDDTLAEGPRANHRRGVLAKEGLVALQPKFSSELGFGRRDIPSGGVGEALEGAGYGGTRLANPSDYASTTRPSHSSFLDSSPFAATAATTAAATAAAASLSSSSSSFSTITTSRPPASAYPPHLVKSGVFNRTVWDVTRGLAAGGEQEQMARAALAATRQPDRVFDTITPPIISTAVGDPWVRAARETREILLTRPVGVVQGKPLPSFTATARSFAASRAAEARRVEIAEVRRLN